jgi:SAM-dependent methyltransferase
MVKNKKNKEWQNTDNILFHENIPINEFKNFVKAGGFDDNQDIDLIMPYLMGLDSLIELGAGYGRVIGALRERGYTGKITAIERSDNFFCYLKDNYLNESNTTIINDDIANMNPSGIFDAALYMWCNISEWPKKSQAGMVKNISKWLKPGGLLILETMDSSQKPINSNEYESQTYKYTNEYGSVYGYIPTQIEIDNYIEYSNLLLIERINYITKTERKRIIYVLKRV